MRTKWLLTIYETEWNSAAFKIPQIETVKSSSNQIFALNVKEHTVIENFFTNMPQLSIHPHSKLMKDKNIILLLDFPHTSLKMSGHGKRTVIQNPNEFSLSVFQLTWVERVTLT